MSILCLLVWCVSLPACSHHDVTPADAPAVPTVTAVEPVPPPEPQDEEIVIEVQPGDALGTILASQGVGGAMAIVEAASEHFNLERIRPGKIFTFVRKPDATISEFRYSINSDNTLHVDLTGTPQARIETVEYQAKPALKKLVVETSFWEAASKLGLSGDDIVRLVELFDYDLDFSRIQPGLTMDIALDELHRDGRFVKYGRLEGARLSYRGKEIMAVRFDGKFYRPDGKAHDHGRAFLRSPLPPKYAFGSGYNPRRVDPINGKIRAHLAVDIGAPTGTPVRATGRGRIEIARWNGGYGNYVRINHGKHEGKVVKTAFGHFSKLKVKKGQAVEQGQIIGLVGSTGHSTCPHVHYEYIVNGKKIDPAKVVLPETTRYVATERRAEFTLERDRILDRLNGGAQQPALESATPIVSTDPELTEVAGLALSEIAEQ